MRNVSRVRQRCRGLLQLFLQDADAGFRRHCLLLVPLRFTLIEVHSCYDNRDSRKRCKPLCRDETTPLVSICLQNFRSVGRIFGQTRKVLRVIQKLISRALQYLQ